MNEAVAVGDTVTKLAGGASLEFAHVSNEQLLEGTRRLVGRSNQVLAALLAHLAEVEARGIHRLCARATLYTYCIYELRFSEDAAARRAAAAKLARRFPPLLEAISRGELHLTGVLQLAPVLTEQNLVEVVGRAKFRTKKEIAKLVRELAPLPAVPDRVEPLGPELPRSLRKPTWAQFVESLCPPVRQLPAGKRPADWVDDAAPSEVLSGAGAPEEVTPSCTQGARSDQNLAPTPAGDDDARSGLLAANDDAVSGQVTATAPARVALPPIVDPQIYQMQFTTSQEHAELVERAKALLSKRPCSLGELHLQAMRLLVEALEKKKYGAARPRKAPADTDSLRSKPSRDVPARIRRAVFERDQGSCTFVDDRGQRCCETHFSSCITWKRSHMAALTSSTSSRYVAKRTTRSLPNETLASNTSLRSARACDTKQSIARANCFNRTAARVSASGVPTAAR